MRNLIILLNSIFLLSAGVIYAAQTGVPKNVDTSSLQSTSEELQAGCSSDSRATYNPKTKKCDCIEGFEFVRKRLSSGERGGTCRSIGTGSAEGSYRGDFGSSPLEILDNVTQRANQGDSIQSTALDDTSQTQGSYPFQYRIANTFDSIRKRSAPYLDWLFYIGLSIAGTLIIRQGLQLVIGTKTPTDIRKPMINIVAGVMILTGVYLIIKLVTSILALILGM